MEAPVAGTSGILRESHESHPVVSRDRRRRADPAANVARYLSLAAAPTFAVMSLLEAAFGIGLPNTLCVAAPRVLPLNGMAVMYALMSVFHAAPWLKAFSRIARMQSGH